MDFKDLRYIYEVFLEKNITKASKNLGITQSTLTLAIQKIERKLGIVIFEKTSNGLIPTEKGLFFINYAQKVLSENKTMKNELKQLIDNTTGTLRVGSTPARCNLIFPNILTKFHDLYPNFKIEMIHDTGDSLLSMLENNLIDFAFILTEETKSNLNYISLKEEEIILCTGKNLYLDHLAIKKKGFKFPWVDINHLKDQTFLCAPTPLKVGTATEKILENANFIPKIFSISMIDVVLELAKKNLGISFCPDIVSTHINFKDYLNFYSTGSHPILLNFSLITRKNFNLTQAYKDFIEISIKEFN